MPAKKICIDELTLSKYMDDYVDGDGWRPNSIDKRKLKEVVQELNTLTDSHDALVSGLEWIRAFDQDGIVASKWLKSLDKTHEYSAKLTELLKKIVDIWHQKLRGIKTYVFVNEVISYLIYCIHTQVEET